MIKVRNILG